MEREGLAGPGREELLEVTVRQQQEVIERQRELIEAWQYAVRCQGCGTRTKGAYPDGLEPTRTHARPHFQSSERIPPTNNASEQDLRRSVIHRKVTGGYRSQLDADVSAILTSLLTTARKRGEILLQALRSVAGPSPLHASGMPR